jgi:hypothetical protein
VGTEREELWSVLHFNSWELCTSVQPQVTLILLHSNSLKRGKYCTAKRSRKKKSETFLKVVFAKSFESNL